MYRPATRGQNLSTRFRSFARDAWMQALAHIFPAKCVACGAAQTYLCIDCARTIEHAHHETQYGVFAAFSYRDPVIQKALWLLKYKGITSLTPTIARAVTDVIGEPLSEQLEYYRDAPVYITAVPTSAARKRSRGYNHAALLAKEIGQHLDIPIALDLVQKIRETPTQVSCNTREARLLNLRGAFSVSHPELTNRAVVIVVDDIYTTGATFNELASALLAAGACDTLGIMVAH